VLTRITTHTYLCCCTRLAYYNPTFPLGRAIRYRYADLHCNTSQALDHEVVTLGCRNFAPQTSIVQSVDVTCASSADLPLLVGTFAVERWALFASLALFPCLLLTFSLAGCTTWQTV
jgi:hypothetical protein